MLLKVTFDMLVLELLVFACFQRSSWKGSFEIMIFAEFHKDSVLLLPESRVCYAGDLLFIGIAPVMWRLGESHEKHGVTSIRWYPRCHWGLDLLQPGWRLWMICWRCKVCKVSNSPGVFCTSFCLKMQVANAEWTSEIRVKVKVFDSLLLLGRLLVKTGSLFRAMGPWQMQQVYDMCEASSTMCIRWDLGDRYRSLRMRRSHEIWWFQRTFLYVFARRWARHVQTCRWHSKSWMRNVTSSDVRVFLHHSGEQQNFIELQWVILPWFAEYSCSTFLHRRLAGLWEDAARFEGCSVGLTSWFMNLEELITSRQHIRRACLAWHTPEQSTPTEGSLLRTWAHCDLRLDREGCIARRRTGESGCAIQGVNWRESPEWQAFHAWMNWTQWRSKLAHFRMSCRPSWSGSAKWVVTLDWRCKHRLLECLVVCFGNWGEFELKRDYLSVGTSPGRSEL